MPPKKGKAPKASKKSEIDERKRDEAKEKTYLIKQLETSIKLLESIEDNVVLDSLLFLSKYGDVQENNMNYLQFLGILEFLFKLLDRNVCIKRVSLRLIDLILRRTEEGIHEVDQERFDDDVLKICDLYINTEDKYTREFAVRCLERIATTCRAPALIYKVDLLKPIQDTVASTEDMVFLEYTLLLLCQLIDNYDVMVALIEPIYFEPATFLEQMNKFEPKITHLVLAIFEKITHACIDGIQKRLKEVKIVEAMLDTILDDTKLEYRLKALRVVNSCMNSEETNCYFTCSKQFLLFSEWAKYCDDEYIFISAEIFEKLSDIPAIRQTLYDLSIEDTILFFLRSMDKKVLNVACKAISNMSTHKYCCNRMLTPVIAKRLFEVLGRQDTDEDPENEVAVKTVHELTMRNPRMVDMLHDYGGINIIVYGFKKGLENLTLDSFLRVLEILNLYINSYYGDELLTSVVYHTILQHFEKYEEDKVSMRLIEIMNYCLRKQDFRSILCTNNIPSLVVKRLEYTTDEYLLKFLLSFVFNCLVYKRLTISFVEARILPTLKAKADGVHDRVPLMNRVINAAYDICLPLKFFETNRLEMTDRIRNCFYIICGQWLAPFPFLEILEMQKISTLSTIYVIHLYPDQVVSSIGSVDQSSMESSGKSLSFDQERSSSSSSRRISFSSGSLKSSLKSTASINYGRLSSDPYLFMYLKQIRKETNNVADVEEKIKMIADFIDRQFSGPKQEMGEPQKIHAHKLHIETLKKKLGTNMIPIGYLRIGFQCERALLFKCLADKLFIPSTLERGDGQYYWNEVALVVGGELENNVGKVKYFIVDLMRNVGSLLHKGSRDANVYCGIK